MPVSRAGVSIIFLAATASRAFAACPLEAGPEHTVTRAITADTLELDDGRQIRLANILGPKADDPNVPHSNSSTNARLALERATAGKTVRLRFDRARKDRYGVTRAHVMVLSDGRETWLQTDVLAAGHARVDARVGERACIADLLAAEDIARANALGVWAESRNRVRPASAPRDLGPYRGTFQIISGTVASIETARDLTRLILGADRRRSTSISFRSNDREILGTIGGDARALIGQTIEARGWLDQRAGSFGAPDIDVSLAGLLRIVSR